MPDQADRQSDTDSEKEERILTFIESMSSGNTLFLQSLEEEALREHVPVIRPQTQSLLKLFLEVKKPRNILEIGTGTGFSALFMLSCAGRNCRLTSIEREPQRFRKAQENVRRAVQEGALEQAGQITLLKGEAETVLESLEDRYDFIFMDGAKGQYIRMLPRVKQLLTEGGLLVSDNIFMGEEVLSSRFAVPRRDRTIHKRMREYLFALTHDPELCTLLLQEGDGAAVSVKRT